MSKRFALTTFLALVVTMLIFASLLSSCRSDQSSSGSDQDTSIPVDNPLLLLSLESEPQEAGPAPVLSDDAEGMVRLAAVNDADQAEEHVEYVNNSAQKLKATVRNESRDSFLDIVLYLSWLDTDVVFNEGNGAYQCSATTILQDGLWVTVIEWETELTFDDDCEAYIEVEEINFLHFDNGSGLKASADLNDETIRSIRYLFDYSLHSEEPQEYRVTADGVGYLITVRGTEFDAVIESIQTPVEDMVLSVRGFIPMKDAFGDRQVRVSRFTWDSIVNPFGATRILFEGTCADWEALIDAQDGMARNRFMGMTRYCVPVECEDGACTIGPHTNSIRPEDYVFTYDADTCVWSKTYECPRCCYKETFQAVDYSDLVLAQAETDLINGVWINRDRSPYAYELSNYYVSLDRSIDLSAIEAIKVHFTLNHPVSEEVLRRFAGTFLLGSSHDTSSDAVYCYWLRDGILEWESDTSGSLLLPPVSLWNLSEDEFESFRQDRVNYIHIYLNATSVGNSESPLATVDGFTLYVTGGTD